VSWSVRTTCRGCGGELHPFLALGEQPLANRLQRPTDPTPVPTYPLTLCRCSSCGLVQLREVVDSGLMFADYMYVPSTSSTMRAHFDDFADVMVRRLRLTAADLVVDIGSNDGLLLSCFQRRGVQVHGIEPAANLAERARKAGVPTTAEFLSLALAERMAETQRASLVTATNVFAHVDDVRGFLRAAVALLSSDGVFVVEVQSFADTVSSLAFDMTYHEHMTYYATAPLAHLCEVEGLQLLDVERVATHGGSLRATIGRAGHPFARPDRIAARIAEEGERAGAAGCAALAAGAEAVRRDLRGLLASIGAAGGRVAAYGAPAKATVLLNYCALGPGDVAYVVDRNEAKQGQRIPGAGIPVVGPDSLEHDPPSHLLLLAWNLADEIVREQAAFAARGGRFVVPVPQPRLLD